MTAITSLFQRFKAAFQAWSQVPDTAANREEIWFAGLAVSPADFSKQLSNLQISLQREGAPSPLAYVAEARVAEARAAEALEYARSRVNG